MINIDQYPVLKALLWDMQNVSELSEADAYLYYESRWRFVDEAEMTRAEHALLQELIKTEGKGVFMPNG